MSHEIIPFGKHKGKPIEILAEDKEYTHWLLAQPWFKTKYQNIYTVVINNFHEPVDTPEHNEMQVKFLNRDYALKFACLLEPRFYDAAKTPQSSEPIFERGYDVSYMTVSEELRLYIKFIVEIKPTIGDDFPSVLRQMKTSMPVLYDEHVTKTFYCLLVRQYVGEGASRDQFIQFFQSQKYTVVFASDVDSVQLPQEGEPPK